MTPNIFSDVGPYRMPAGVCVAAMEPGQYRRDIRPMMHGDKTITNTISNVFYEINDQLLEYVM